MECEVYSIMFILIFKRYAKPKIVLILIALTRLSKVLGFFRKRLLANYYRLGQRIYEG